MHTPLRLSETCDHRPAIADATGINIASWDQATIDLFDDVRTEIVKAVNSYEAMKKALETLYDDAWMSEANRTLIALALAEGKEQP